MDFARKYAGLDSGGLLRAETELTRQCNAVGEKIAAEHFAAGRYETQELGPDGFRTEGPQAVSLRTRRDHAGTPVVDVATWLPSDYPELNALHAEVHWLQWKINELRAPGAPEPPRQPPPR